MLVWRNLVLEPNFDSFWFQTRLNRDFIFWSFICTMIDTQTQIRGLNKSNWLQNWEYSQIMLVWHLSLTQSQMLYLWKCDRPMSKVIFCILKQRTCRCKTQKRNHQQRMYCPQILVSGENMGIVTLTFLKNSKRYPPTFHLQTLTLLNITAILITS